MRGKSQRDLIADRWMVETPVLLWSFVQQSSPSLINLSTGRLRTRE